MQDKKRIVASAIFINGIAYTGLRHTSIISYLVDLGFPIPITGEQGFIDDLGVFHDRKEAGEIALAAGQIDKLHWPGMGLDSSEIFPRTRTNSLPS